MSEKLSSITLSSKVPAEVVIGTAFAAIGPDSNTTAIIATNLLFIFAP